MSGATKPRRRLPRGIDPALEKKRARIAAKYTAVNTFEAVAAEWLVKCERDGLAPVTVDKMRWLLAKAYPLIGTIPIAQITPHEVLAVLRKVEATGDYESARRMRSVLSRVFRYGVATVRCDKDVAADLRGAIAVPKVKHFAAITRPSEVGALLRAIDGYKVVILHGLRRWFDAQQVLRAGGQRVSRHYYDVHQLMIAGTGASAMAHQELGRDCVAHARMFFNSRDLDLAHAGPGSFSLIPTDAMILHLSEICSHISDNPAHAQTGTIRPSI